MKTKWLALAFVAALVPAGVVRASTPAGRYTVVGGVLVLDNKTQLRWQKTPSTATYSWGSASTAGTAQNYCATLTLDGLGWRLPTIKELLTLVDYSQAGGSMIDPSFATAPTPSFWSATPTTSAATQVWFLVYGYGDMEFAGPNNTYSVRCVR